MTPRHVKARKALYTLFITYCVIMLLLLFARSSRYFGGSYIEQLKANLNLRPFETMRRFIYVIRHNSNPYMLKFAHLNLTGNIVAFIPFGFFMPSLFEPQQKLLRFVLSSAGIIAAIELTQLFTLRGSCDIDDLILNLTGALLGYVIWRLTEIIKSKKS